MQSTGRTAAAVPQTGPNRLQQALQDYDQMEHELTFTKDQLAQATKLAHELRTENDMLKEHAKTQSDYLVRQLEVITAHRDRLQVTLKGLMTRFKVIRECFTNAETEALAEGLKLVEETTEAETSPEERAALARVDLGNPDRMPQIPFGHKGLDFPFRIRPGANAFGK